MPILCRRLAFGLTQSLMATFVLSTLTVAGYGAPRYTVTDLGALPGGTSSGATSISSDGSHVAGNSNVTGGQFHAFVYSSGTMTDLGLLPGYDGCGATGVNNSGQVTGTLSNSGDDNARRAFLYSSGVMNSIGVVGGFMRSYGTGIDNYGEIVGYLSPARTSTGNNHSFAYIGGTMMDTGSGDPYDNEAWAISSLGHVAGQTGWLSGAGHSYLETGTSTIDIAPYNGYGIVAQAVSDNDYVAGEYMPTHFDSRSFIYHDGVTSDLGAIRAESVAHGVNDAGQVVGYSRLDFATPDDGIAYIYQSGSMIDLNTLIDSASGWTLNSASAINDAGQIVGGGVHNGHNHAFLLTPIYPPSLIADFNGDHQCDLVLQNAVTRRIGLWFMNGPTVGGGQYVSLTPSTGWQVIGAKDFNNDGKTDLVLQNQASGKIALWYLNGATVTGGQYISMTPTVGWLAIATGDVNGDGKPDLVLQNTTTHDVEIWYLDGASVTGMIKVSEAIPSSWTAECAGDFNGNGTPDLVLQNSATHQFRILGLNGSSVISDSVVSLTPPAGWSVVAAGDYNGDGKLDLVLQKASTGQIALWNLNGTTVTGGHYASVTPAAGWAVAGPR